MTRLNHGFEYRERLGADAAGLTLIEYLVQRYPRFTREDWMNRIDSSRVLLDGIPSKVRAILKPGQQLSWMRPPWEEPDVPRSFAILYRDEHMLAVAKPGGLPTIPCGGGFLEHTLLSLVRRRFPEASPSHRLGRGTSGIVLFTMTQKAAAKISQAWSCGEVLKIYRALATGCPVCDEFEVNTPIGPVPHRVLKTVYAASPSGKPARSQVRVLERRDASSLLQVRITTGRPHQVRIHVAAAGHPLLGDRFYAVGGIPAEDSQALPGDTGYYLHHALLGFPHPVTGEWIEITCAPPHPLRESPGQAPATGRGDRGAQDIPSCSHSNQNP